MYFEKLEIKNYGPLKSLDINFPFSDAEKLKPKPLVVVGKNGSGKSIFLSHLVNTLIEAKASLYPNTEVQDGRVYKLISPYYITAGEHYAFMKLHLSNGLEFYEWILSCLKKEFESLYKYIPKRQEWAEVPDEENSAIKNNCLQKHDELKKLVDSSCSLYFPPNRFEEPGWLNKSNLLSKPEHTDKKRIKGESERNILCHSPLKANMNWLFDLLLDRELYERKTVDIGLPITISVFQGYEGPSDTVYSEAIKLLQVILKDKNVRFGVGTRRLRQMSIVRGQNTVVPHIFQMSTGETALLNLFLSIIRDFDISDGVLTSLESITGIVIVDEIDAHLHTQLQYEVLPELISLFPRIQFIITTHSPIFLLGLKKKFGQKGFEIRELPDADVISTERFSEFENAYRAFVETERFQSNVKDEILNSQKPIVFVEGEYDKKYIEKAAEFLNKGNLLSQIKIRPANGFGKLDNIWRHSNWPDPQLEDKKVMLLYDCDTGKSGEDRGNIFKRVIPAIPSNPIRKGIENLFPETTIDKVENHSSAFVDIDPEKTVRQRGKEITIQKTKSINKDEKGNMCNWLCENGDKDDFSNFITIFKLIEGPLSLSADH